MTLRDMLGAVKASVSAARAGSRASSSASETSGISDDPSDSGRVEVSADVPDLGPLHFLGTDRRGREVAETVNLHWRAYAKQF
jgi:hypothetical protein